jgi:hypothetical protein
MKPLILILLAATYAAAQNPTIADIARQERAKRAQNTSSKVYTTADIKTAAPTPGDADKPAVEPGATPAPAATPTAAVPSAAPAPDAAAPEAAKADPLQQWLQESEKLRSEIRELVDREATTQLEINAITNRVYAPVTSMSERDRAQTELQAAQGRLVIVRDLLAKKRAELQKREEEGPPKKQ